MSKRTYAPKKKTSKKRRRIQDSAFSESRSVIVSPAYVAGNWRRPLPYRVRSSSRYCETLVDINPGAAGIAAEYVYAANGLYDPNITGAGHQPIGWDQMIGLYEKGVVLRSKITVTGWNSDASYPQQLMVYMSNSATTSTDQIINIENGNCAYTVIGPYGTTTNGSCLGEVTLSFDAKKWFQKKSIADVVAGEELCSQVGNNPTNLCYFHVSAQPLSSSDTGYIRCTVCIDYDVIYFEPAKINSS